MNNEILVEGFGEVEHDAIGEILNITMGSAATAVSNLLGAKVWITTPEVNVVRARDLTYPEFEPSICVTIDYIKGISGKSVLVLKQTDVQLILNQLMGQPLVVTDDFEFDEMNISAVSEVMNQMMGASSTALSELIEEPVDISTPVANVHEANAPFNDVGMGEDEYACQVKFDLTIDGVIKSEFMSLMTLDLAKSMANKMLEGYGSPDPEPAPAPTPSNDVISSSSSGGGMMSQEEIEKLLGGGGGSPAPTPSPAPAPQQAPMQPQMDPNMGAMNPQMMGQQMPYGGYPQPQYDPNMAAQMGMNPQMMGQQMPYGGYPQYGQYPPQGNYNVQPIQLKSFEDYNNTALSKEQNDNLKLLMGIPLDVTVELGFTNKKVKDILEFQQGTIIELDRQAGAPVDVIVNGHLIARGDVVVIGDNFAVRVTEILKTSLLDTLSPKSK